MAEAVFYFFYGLLFAAICGLLRLAVGPRRYAAIAEPLTNGLFCVLFFGGTTLLCLFAARSEPLDAMLWFCVVVFACGALVGLGMLWQSAYALWFWRRPLVEIDSDGIRLWALAYRHVPWTRIAAVADHSDNSEVPKWFVTFADGHRERLGFLPLDARHVMVGWGRDLAEITAAADPIRQHASYRERAAAA
jgi:hypothetical protein